MTEVVYAGDIECRCDCVNCVTGNHDGCYYEPACHLKDIASKLKVEKGTQ